MDERYKDPIERFLDAVLGFVWRWFWRIALWGIVAIIGILAILYAIEWSSKDRIGWMAIIIGGLLGGILHCVHECKRLLQHIVHQNDDLRRNRLDTYPD